MDLSKFKAKIVYFEDGKKVVTDGNDFISISKVEFENGLLKAYINAKKPVKMFSVSLFYDKTLKDDELLRERAELINFKRRLNEEKINDRKYANQALLADLINVIDIFDRVVSSPAQDEKVKKYLVGFQMINEQLKGVMSQYGVTKIDALNKPFDATRHEAIETIESDCEPNMVIEVISDGYMFKDRVLRPSMVKVSKQKENK